MNAHPAIPRFKPARIAGGASDEPPMIRPLSSIWHDDRAFAGELAVQLASEARAGLRSPAGFVIGTPAFAALCGSGFLLRRLVVTLTDVCVGDPERLMAAASMARSIVTCEAVPDTVRDPLDQAYAALMLDHPGAAVTVAASNAEEALPPLALGPCERFEHLRSHGAVAHAVRACWSSLFDARRVYERAQRGLPQVSKDIAVVVVLEPEAGSS